MNFVPHGITLRAAVPEAPVEFVDGFGVLAVAIHGEIGTARVVLTAITHVLNVTALGGMRMVWVGACHHVVGFQVFVGELIQGLLTQFVITPV